MGLLPLVEILSVEHQYWSPWHKSIVAIGTFTLLGQVLHRW
jgi:hypothetical protein